LEEIVLEIFVRGDVGVEAQILIWDKKIGKIYHIFS
jgi:hypothetical protein